MPVCDLREPGRWQRWALCSLSLPLRCQFLLHLRLPIDGCHQTFVFAMSDMSKFRLALSLAPMQQKFISSNFLASQDWTSFVCAHWHIMSFTRSAPPSLRSRRNSGFESWSFADVEDSCETSRSRWVLDEAIRGCFRSPSTGLRPTWILLSQRVTGCVLSSMYNNLSSHCRRFRVEPLPQRDPLLQALLSSILDRQGAEVRELREAIPIPFPIVAAMEVAVCAHAGSPALVSLGIWFILLLLW